MDRGRGHLTATAVPGRLVTVSASPSNVTGSDTAARRRAADTALIAALLTGSTYAVAAEQAGVSLSTVNRRMGDPGFQRRLQEAQEEAIKAVRRRATAGAQRALDTLMAIAENRDGAAADGCAGVRAGAARAILAAFVQLQPRHLSAEVDGGVTVRYEIAGVDMGALQ